jgi:hypothetical protein
MDDKIQARLILEILGRPASNVTEALTNMVDKMSKEKGVIIIEKKIHDVLPVKDVQDLFTSFAEVMIECDKLPTFFSIVFGYMPSNIEIIKPDTFAIRNAELSLLTNNILSRLHNYDAIARRLLVDNSLLKQKLGISNLSEQTQARVQEKVAEQKEEPKKEEEKKESKPKKPAKKSQKKKKK